MGACIDDRNFRGIYADVMATYHVIYDYDIAAGHMLQASKNVMMATSEKSREALKKVVYQNVMGSRMPDLQQVLGRTNSFPQKMQRPKCPHCQDLSI